MHGLVTLVGIEAALIGILHLVARGGWYRTCTYLLAVTAPLELYRTTVRDVNASLFRLSVAVVLTTLVVDRLRRRGRTPSPARPRSAAWSLAGAYLLLALVAAASLVDVGGSFLGERLVAVLVLGAVVVFLAAQLAARTSTRELATAFVAGATLPILAAAWQLLGPRLDAGAALPLRDHLPVGPGLDDSQAEAAYLNPAVSSAVRARGTIDDPNHFGIYLVCVVFVASGLAAEAARERRRGRAVAFAAMAAAAGAALVATYSRSAWLAVALGSITCALMLRPAIRQVLAPRNLAIVAALLAATAALLLAAAGPTLAARLSPGSPINAVSNSGHRENAAVGIRMFRSRPVVGIGAGQLSIVLSGPNPRAAGADSTYVTTAAELGAVGLFALALGAGMVLQLLWHARRRPDDGLPAFLPVALLGAYVGFIVANAFHDEWWRDFHFVLLGLVAAIGDQARATAEAG